MRLAEGWGFVYLAVILFSLESKAKKGEAMTKKSLDLLV
jgi:hypothetical protein